MATIMRHGGEAHVVRPDRVYRTGVLSPIVGYQPQADVQAVAAAFTLGPPSGMDLQGLRGFGAAGFFQRLGAAFKARFQRQPVAALMPMSGPPAPQAPGPTQQAAAMQLSPEMAGRMQAVYALVGRPGMSRGSAVARAADVPAWRRDSSYYWAG